MAVVATYHGRCAECDETIAPGQRIERTEDDDAWRHTNCHAMPERAECVCSDCWTVHVGECI
jgi:hypothetical protein